MSVQTVCCKCHPFIHHHTLSQNGGNIKLLPLLMYVRFYIVDGLGIRLSTVMLKLLTCDSSSNLSDAQTSLAISLTYYRKKSKLRLILPMVQSANSGARLLHINRCTHARELFMTVYFHFGCQSNWPKRVCTRQPQ